MTDPLGTLGIDHIRLLVGNARQVACYWQTVWGFTPIAYAGPETGHPDAVSYVLRQGNAALVVTSAICPDATTIAAHVARHGDGVSDIAFSVVDVTAAFDHAVRSWGPSGVGEVTELNDPDESVVRIAAIRAYGDTVHSVVERREYHGLWAPGYKPLNDASASRLPSVGVRAVDHANAVIPVGETATWVDFYARVLGFTQLQQFGSEEVEVVMTKVLGDASGRIKLPLTEPVVGQARHVSAFLEAYGGPGVQHIAFLTDDIVASVRALRARGLKFMPTPRQYYEALPTRLDGLDHLDLDALAELGILVDQDDEGYLLQIFTEPLGDRATVFFELIERHGSRGFGARNIQALAEAAEQALATPRT